MEILRFFPPFFYCFSFPSQYDLKGSVIFGINDLNRKDISFFKGVFKTARFTNLVHSSCYRKAFLKWHDFRIFFTLFKLLTEMFGLIVESVSLEGHFYIFFFLGMMRLNRHLLWFPALLMDAK